VAVSQKINRQPEMVTSEVVPGGGIEPPTRGFSVPIEESGDFPPFFKPLDIKHLRSSFWDMLGFVGLFSVVMVTI